MKKKYLIVTLCLLSTLMTACSGTDLSNKNTDSYIEETESTVTEDIKKSDKSDENTKIKNDSTENDSQKETESSETKNNSETEATISTESSKSENNTEIAKDNIPSADNTKENTNSSTPNKDTQNSIITEPENQAPSQNNEPQGNLTTETPSPESTSSREQPTKEDSNKLVIKRTYTPLNKVEDSKINDVFCDVGSYLGEDYLPKMSIFTNEIVQTCNLSKNSVEYAYGEAPFLPTDKDFLIAIKTLDGSQELIEKSAKEYVDLLKNDSGQDSNTLAKYQSVEVYRYDRYVFIIGTFGKSDDSNTDSITKTSSENIQKALAAIKNNF